jgi:hypothetical protein
VSAYRQLRLLLLTVALLAGGGIALWRGTLDYQAAVTEAAPTPIDVAAFASYGGQRWLKVQNGIFLTDLAVTRDGSGGPDTGGDQATIYVPLVPRGWQAGDPVHVICRLGPGPRANVAGWLKENGGGTLRNYTGVVSNEPAGLHFRGLKIEEPALLIREGGKPDGPEVSLGVIVVGAVLVLAGGVLGVWLLRTLLRRQG